MGEQPELTPVPKDIKNCTIVEKIDGSTLLVSIYKGEFIFRTRGTIDATKHENGAELEIFKEKYKNILQEINSTFYDYTFIFEWTSPKNRIIISYGEEPEWYLIGVIDNRDYTLAKQITLDLSAITYNIKRPQTYTFESVEDLVENVEEWKSKEGVCLYYNGGQNILKIKGKWYLQLHSLKSEISSAEKLVDVYLNWGMPTYQEFEKKIIETFDFELFSQIRGDVSKICEAKIEADKIINHMLTFISPLKNEPRKNAALEIIKSYGQTNRKSMCFLLLDGKMLGAKEYKTLILQSLVR